MHSRTLEPGGRTSATLVRRRLIECIEFPYLAPITLVTAPAGYGKSTIAAQWMAQANHPVGWIVLGPEANSLAVCLARLDAAIAALPGAGDAQDPEPTFDAILHRLQAVAGTHGDVSLVLDDYHHITNPDVHRVMDALLVQLPANVHLLILSRALPPFSLARRRVQGLVRELTEADLRFTDDEAQALVAAEPRGRLSSAQVARLARRTDGWITGLRLALLALDHLPPDGFDAFIDTLAEHQWLDDYLVDEVLADLPPEVRRFVLRTAGLGPLTPELCDAALGIEGSAALIDEIARRLVFARRDGTAMTYQALFADGVARIAKRLLPAGDSQATHRRAAAWFERHGQPETAIEHALRGKDLETAVRLTRAILPGLMDIDWSHSVIHLLHRLPVAVIAGDPELAYGFIYSAFMIGQARDARQMFDRVERAWMASGDPVQQGRALACHIYSRVLWGDSTEAELQALRHQALALLPEECTVERLHLWGGIAAEAYFHGNDEIGEDAFRKAEMYAARLPSEQIYWLVVDTIQRPNRTALRGNLRVAIALYERALEQISVRLRFWEGSYHQRLAAIHLERDDLAKARAHAGQYEPDLVISPWEVWFSEAWITSAQIARASGEIEPAYALLERAIGAIEESGVLRMAHHARALQASWWLADGELDLARGWDQTTPAAQLDWSRTYGLMHGQLTRVQLRAAEGDYAAALALAQELIAEGGQRKRWAEVIPFSVWEAVARFELGDREAALAALRTALRLGMPGGFVRSFAPLGADVEPLFAWATPFLTAEEAAYLRRVLGVEPTDPAVRATAVLAVERAARAIPLSPREREVLGHLQAGRTNRQIAAAIFLTERTVRMHVGNLLAKLGVRNRTAAVVRARELGLLDGPDSAA